MPQFAEVWVILSGTQYLIGKFEPAWASPTPVTLYPAFSQPVELFVAGYCILNGEVIRDTEQAPNLDTNPIVIGSAATSATR